MHPLDVRAQHSLGGKIWVACATWIVLGLSASWTCVLPCGSSENVALGCLAKHQSLQNPLPPGKLVGRLNNPMEPGEVFGEALAVSKVHFAHCALLLELIGRYLPSTLPLAAQFYVLIHLALVHESLAAQLAGVPRQATVHGLLVSVDLPSAVKHITTQCAVGLQSILPPLEVVHRPCRVEELLRFIHFSLFAQYTVSFCRTVAFI